MQDKKIVSFSINPHFFDEKKLEFKETSEGKVQIDAVLFSTAYNRNNAFFQVSNLLKWKNKLNRVLHNFNHDLSLTGGKYLGNKTKLIEMRELFNEGELEIWGTVESTDKDFVSQAENITAPSIEIAVSPEDIIQGENGEYYKDFDFLAVAWLLGVPQGSGDARVEAVRHFDAGLNELDNYNNQNNINMNKQELQAILAENYKEILSKFDSKIDEVKTSTENSIKEFKESTEKQIKEFKVVGGSQSSSESVYEWTKEDGTKMKDTYQSFTQSITEELDSGEVKEDSKLAQLMKAKGFALVKIEDDIDSTINNAKKQVENMKQFRSKEGKEDDRSADTSADAKVNFKSELAKQVKENIKNAK